MEDKIKSILRDSLNKNKANYLDKAIKSVSDKSQLERQIVNHALEIKEKEIFNDDIKKTIKFITDLKEKGYTSISQYWSGYEENYFRADKYELETDDEYATRLYHIVNEEIDSLIEKEEEAQKDKKEIEKLERRIKELKNKKYDTRN